MEIQIERLKLTNQQIRKIKLLKLKRTKRIIIPIKYNWKILVKSKKEAEETKVENLYLFCISIVKDLLSNVHETDQDGKYEHDTTLKHKYSTLQDLQKLFDNIAKNTTLKHLNG